MQDKLKIHIPKKGRYVDARQQMRNFAAQYDGAISDVGGHFTTMQTLEKGHLPAVETTVDNTSQVLNFLVAIGLNPILAKEDQTPKEAFENGKRLIIVTSIPPTKRA